MSFKPLLFLVATLMASNIVYAADCTLPKAPRNIPNGAKATKEEMTTAHEAIKEYNDKTAAYTECLKTEFERAVAEKGDKLTDKDRKSMDEKVTRKHNAAMDKLQGVADKFNEQVRIFNAKEAADKK